MGQGAREVGDGRLSATLAEDRYPVPDHEPPRVLEHLLDDPHTGLPEGHQGTHVDLPGQPIVGLSKRIGDGGGHGVTQLGVGIHEGQSLALVPDTPEADGHSHL